MLYQQTLKIRLFIGIYVYQKVYHSSIFQKEFLECLQVYDIIVTIFCKDIEIWYTK